MQTDAQDSLCYVPATTMQEYIKASARKAEYDYQYYNRSSDDLNLLPDDAAYLMRYNAMISVTELLEELQKESGKHLTEVLQKAVMPNIEGFNGYMFYSTFINKINEKWGTTNE